MAYAARGVLLIAGLGLPIGCATAERTLAEHARSWRATAPDSYEFEYEWGCFCPGAGTWWRVAVANGRVVSAQVVDSTNVGKGGPVPPRGGQPTIDSVFAHARRALEDGNASVTILYDSAYHFPRELTVDRDERAIDDEWSIHVRAFRRVQ